MSRKFAGWSPFQKHIFLGSWRYDFAGIPLETNLFFVTQKRHLAITVRGDPGIWLHILHKTATPHSDCFWMLFFEFAETKIEF